MLHYRSHFTNSLYKRSAANIEVQFKFVVDQLKAANKDVYRWQNDLDWGRGGGDQRREWTSRFECQRFLNISPFERRGQNS